MGWHNGSPRQNKSAFWLVIFIAIGVAMMSGHGRSFGGWWWMFLLIPLFMSGSSHHRRRYYRDPWDRHDDASADASADVSRRLREAEA